MSDLTESLPSFKCYNTKISADENVRFHVPLIFTLIAMLFLALEARGEEKYCTPIVSTFLAVNTSSGVQLVYKNSGSSNTENITFERLYLSSAKACGMNYRRCPNLTVIMDDNVVVVVMPLQEHFGLVTFNINDGNFSFREKYAINIANLELECEISTISEYFPRKLTVIGRCLHTKTNPKLLNSVYVVINSSSLSESHYFAEFFCNIHLPSEFVVLQSTTFSMGVTVFIDNGQVKYQKYGEDCEPFGEISVCSDVQRFTSVTPDLQAIYCQSTTYLLDLVSLPAIKTFNRDNDGLPFFCSKLAYSTYKNESIFFHHINKTQIGSAVPVGFLFNKEDVVWGDCVNSMFVVIQSAEGKVISLTINTRKVSIIGHSQTIPRIFGTTVLLNNLTHALVYDLQTSKLHVIKQEFMMGYVVSNYLCVTFGTAAAKTTNSPQLFDTIVSSLVALLIIILSLFGIGSYIYCRKYNKKCYRVKRKRSRSNVAVNKENYPNLELADSDMILQESAAGSGPPQLSTLT